MIWALFAYLTAVWVFALPGIWNERWQVVVLVFILAPVLVPVLLLRHLLLP